MAKTIEDSIQINHDIRFQLHFMLIFFILINIEISQLEKVQEYSHFQIVLNSWVSQQLLVISYYLEKVA